ncbi:hemerythrin domain-containing protein [Novosphingobium gossypii]|uniref:hemerythrin domain-containing protein n=1 Tax=Novosphingobium gossypii TaxID=1604774 RepID=UPI003D1FC8E0
MSFLDRIAAAVAPAASDEARGEARRHVQQLASAEPWLAPIVDQHKQIESLVLEAINANTAEARTEGMRQLAVVLTAHSTAEEAVVYPDISEFDTKTYAAMAYEEHAMTKVQLAKLEKINPMSEEWQEKLRHIEGALQQHMYQEEKSWLPALSQALPEEEKQRIAARYAEEYDRYRNGAQEPSAAPSPRTVSDQPNIDAALPADTHQTQAMPRDGRPGAPDGVNTQAQFNATDGSDAGAPYPNPHTGKSDAEREDMGNTVLGHGGQSTIGYHGSGRLGDRKVKPDGNVNSGSPGD